MPAPRLTDEQCREAVEAVELHGSQAKAADAIGLSRTGIQTRLNEAARRGMLLKGEQPMPGYEIKSVASKIGDKWVKQVQAPGEEFAPPEGFKPGRITVLTDADGREQLKWQRWNPDELSIEAIIENVKSAFAGYEPAAKPTPRPALVKPDLLTLIPLADWHIGMFAWHREVSQNWDMDIAERVLGEAVEDLVSASTPSGTGVVLVGGDLLHSDNNDNKTARSGNALQVDGRYQKTVRTAIHLVVRTIDAALRKHEKVIVRVLPGNHDEHASVAVTWALHAWYRNEPRVQVDVDASLFWWFPFGKVLLGATHGHTVKIKEMPSIMAHRRAEDWGRSKWRYIHGFHLHHKEVLATEGKGVICEIHQAPIPQDAWHFGAGFLSGRSMQAIRYHREYGEVGRNSVALLDGGDAPPAPAHGPTFLEAA